MVFTKSYRSDHSTIGRQPEIQIGESLTFDIPEPPSLNTTLRITGANPMVRVREANAYKKRLQVQILAAGVQIPATPWERWALTRMQFRLHGLRDRLELPASLKWAIDALVKLGFAVGDDPKRFDVVCFPEQVIARDDRGVTITIRRDA